MQPKEPAQSVGKKPQKDATGAAQGFRLQQQPPSPRHQGQKTKLLPMQEGQRPNLARSLDSLHLVQPIGPAWHTRRPNTKAKPNKNPRG